MGILHILEKPKFSPMLISNSNSENLNNRGSYQVRPLKPFRKFWATCENKLPPLKLPFMVTPQVMDRSTLNALLSLARFLMSGSPCLR